MRQAAYMLNPYELSEAARNASRQVWLAGLGAAVVTRDWVQNEAGQVFKSLVRQGTTVESRAIRFVGDQVETSVSRANTVWKRARRTVEATVRQTAGKVVDYAQLVIPKSLPLQLPPIFVKLEKQARKAAPAKRAAAPKKKIVRARKAPVVRKAKRAVRKAAAA